MRGYYPGEREHRRRSQPRVRRQWIPQPRGELHLPRRRRRAGADRGAARAAAAGAARRLDWAIGILLGIALGIAVVVAFLLFGSEGTIDAPRIHGVRTGKPPAARSAPAPAPTSPAPSGPKPSRGE